MPESAHRILIAGSLTRDRVHFAKTQTELSGGVVWHAGRALVALGVPVTVVTRTAPGDRALLNPLVAAGVHVVWESAGHTTTMVLRYDPENTDKRTLDVEALAEPVRAESLRAALGDRLENPAGNRGDKVKLLYLGPVHEHDLGIDCIGVIREHPSVRVALDVQGLARQQSGCRLVPARSQDLDQWLAVTDVLKASEDEARTLLDETTIPTNSLMQALAEAMAERMRGREVVMTSGLAGAWTWHHGTVSHAPAQPVPGDPTGAGDLFFATYLARRGAGDPCDAAARQAAAHVARGLSRKKAGQRP